MSELEILEHGGGRRIAFRRRPGSGPTLLFLPGYMSDMDGGKAIALDAWAGEAGRAMVRFDYGGCGVSEGDFAAQGLDDWLGDTLAAIDRLVDGPVLLVGSSMGGWLMLLAALARPERVVGVIGIAPAPDFTSWGFSDEEKRIIRDNGRLEQPSPYGDEPYVTTRTFWESGERHLLLGGRIAVDCPVRLLHGQADADVPWRNSLLLAERLRSADVQTILIKNGDHRLSRDQDIALLIRTVDGLLEHM
ncbi:MAG TPA: alpha/beta hydrolase [Allosphingosinicella sp.]|nr:alpha/beta hydrolase [Allosphingosinicella sp.]